MLERNFNIGALTSKLGKCDTIKVVNQQLNNTLRKSIADEMFRLIESTKFRDYLRRQCMESIDGLKHNFIEYSGTHYSTHAVGSFDHSNVYRCVSYILFGSEQFWENLLVAVAVYVQSKWQEDYNIYQILQDRELTASGFFAKYHSRKSPIPPISMSYVDMYLIGKALNITIHLFDDNCLTNGANPHTFKIQGELCSIHLHVVSDNIIYPVLKLNSILPVADRSQMTGSRYHYWIVPSANHPESKTFFNKSLSSSNVSLTTTTDQYPDSIPSYSTSKGTTSSGYTSLDGFSGIQNQDNENGSREISTDYSCYYDDSKQDDAPIRKAPKRRYEDTVPVAYSTSSSTLNNKQTSKLSLPKKARKRVFTETSSTSDELFAPDVPVSIPQNRKRPTKRPHGRDETIDHTEAKISKASKESHTTEKLVAEKLLPSLYVNGKEAGDINVTFKKVKASRYDPSASTLSCKSIRDCYRHSFHPTPEIPSTYNPTDDAFKITEVSKRGKVYVSEKAPFKYIFNESSYDNDGVFYHGPDEVYGQEYNENGFILLGVISKYHGQGYSYHWSRNGHELYSGIDAAVIRVNKPGTYSVGIRLNDHTFHKYHRPVEVSLKKGAESDDKKMFGTQINDDDRSRLAALILGENIKVKSIPHQSSRSNTFTVHQVFDDENSFFRSIAFILFGNDTFYKKIRGALYSYMKDPDNSYELSKLYLAIAGDNNINKYLNMNDIKSLSVEADEMAIASTACMLNVPIHLFDNERFCRTFLPSNNKFGRGIAIQRLGKRKIPDQNLHVGHFNPVLQYHKSNLKQETDTHTSEDSVSNVDSLRTVEEKKRPAWDISQSRQKLQALIDRRTSTAKVSSPAHTKSSYNSILEKDLCLSESDSSSDDESLPEPAKQLGIVTSASIESLATDVLSNEGTSTEQSDDEEDEDKEIFFYEKDQSNDSTKILMYVKHVAGMSRKENIKWAVERVLKQSIRVLPKPKLKTQRSFCESIHSNNQLEEFLKEHEFSTLVWMLNEDESLYEEETVRQHFIQRMLNASLIDLFDAKINIERAIDHKTEVIDMRVSLTEFESSFYKDDEHNQSDDLQFACLAIPTRDGIVNKLIGYYHNGKQSGENAWRKIAINPELQTLKPFLSTNKYIVDHTTLYVLLEGRIARTDIFEKSPVVWWDVPFTDSMADIILTRSNQKKIYAVDRKNKQIAVVGTYGVSPWFKTKSMNVTAIPRWKCNQLIFESNGVSELACVAKNTDKVKATVLIDSMSQSRSNVPKIHEFDIGSYQLTKDFMIVSDMNKVKVKLPQYSEGTDTKYMLIPADTLKERINFFFSNT